MREARKYGYFPIGIYVSSELKEKIVACATEKGVSNSTFIWLIVSEYMDKLGG